MYLLNIAYCMSQSKIYAILAKIFKYSKMRIEPYEMIYGNNVV